MPERVLLKGNAMRWVAVFLVFVFSLPGAVLSDCVRDLQGAVMCGAGQCERDEHGDVYCAPVGGGAVRDRYGTVKCGVGQCARDSYGKIFCSVVPGGGAATDGYGKVKCFRGCEPASEMRCEAGQ